MYTARKTVILCCLLSCKNIIYCGSCIADVSEAEEKPFKFIFQDYFLRSWVLAMPLLWKSSVGKVLPIAGNMSCIVQCTVQCIVQCTHNKLRTFTQ